MKDDFGCPRISTATYFLYAQKVRKKAPEPLVVFLELSGRKKIDLDK